MTTLDMVSTTLAIGSGVVFFSVELSLSVCSVMLSSVPLLEKFEFSWVGFGWIEFIPIGLALTVSICILPLMVMQLLLLMQLELSSLFMY